MKTVLNMCQTVFYFICTGSCISEVSPKHCPQLLDDGVHSRVCREAAVRPEDDQHGHVD